ncbi:MAG: class I SAM-dependent methyltransferase, partial [Alistipes sp.]|nr:class I SAM-dependent methyltransferase [Alistipes sp.]
RGRRSEERAEWSCKRGMPEQRYLGYEGEGFTLKMRLGLTAFKHVGIFPEQAENWEYIFRSVQQLRSVTPEVQVLNLFAYTGGATLAARAAGAGVTHVDSVRPVVNWARENLEASHLEGVRWMVDDALKFVRREVKRGKRYHGIILDPPAYGRGVEGEKWVLEEQLNEMLTLCGALLTDTGFLVLNLYSMGLSALLARSAVQQLIGAFRTEEFGELYFTDSFGKALPLGVFYRGGR